MTLAETIKVIEVVAMRQPSINMIVQNDVFRLNAAPDARYGVFAWLQGQHSTAVDNGMMTFSFTFFYVDRLTDGFTNQIEVQSVGIQTLDNIIRELERFGVYASGTYSFQTFNQRFNDECAGVFCTLNLEVPIGSACPDSFADYSNDFNADFYIF